MTLKELEAKVDAGALITEMSAKLKMSSDRWDEVCRIYGSAWTESYGVYSKILEDIQAKKEARIKAEANAISACLQLACVFLPMIGGSAAISLAPILSTRAKLLTSTVTKKVAAKWTTITANRPITTQILKQIGEVSAGKATEAAEKIQTSIVDALTPKVPEIKAEPSVTDPVSEFINNSRRTLDVMNAWVATCATWNAKGGIERILIPVAHDFFMNHPWVTSAPAIEATQKMRQPVAGLIEMSLWLRWARRLEEEYWLKVSNWYYNDYQRSSPEGKRYQATGKGQSWAVDLLDFQPVYFRLEKLTGYNSPFDRIVMYSAKTRLDHPTVDLHSMITIAKSSHKTLSLLEKFMPSEKRQSEFLRELAKM